eukprot:TRINITY_DN84217_c0_g1_i1.p1 TRINITY_DN84217_c0_g1~~TRINITY_DN84217_c0_g1_i1.p1  ORF type:complete len:205 (+),score=35.89 TRINITY_DN84217_c0_g1_i1:65-616(+)
MPAEARASRRRAAGGEGGGDGFPKCFLPDYKTGSTRQPGWQQDRTDNLGGFTVTRWGYFPQELNICVRCGAALDLASVSTAQVSCKFCSFAQAFDPKEDLQAGHAVIEAVGEPAWWKDEDEEIEKIKAGVEKEDTIAYPEIAMECQGCGHDKLQFWTRQLRSADEGQTVYFLCKKCGWRTTEN